jgi:hypothetical protein
LKIDPHQTRAELSVLPKHVPAKHRFPHCRAPLSPPPPITVASAVVVVFFLFSEPPPRFPGMPASSHGRVRCVLVILFFGLQQTGGKKRRTKFRVFLDLDRGRDRDRDGDEKKNLQKKIFIAITTAIKTATSTQKK